MNDKIIVAVEVGVKGGAGSGNWGHTGRPGLVGGSGGRAGAFTPGGIVPGSGERGTTAAYNILNAGLEGLQGDYLWRYASDEERARAKEDIVHDLTDRANGDLPEWGELDPSEVGEFIKQWAISSNNSDMRSLGIQQDATKEFGVDLSNWQQAQIATQEKWIASTVGVSSLASAHSLFESNQQRAIIRAMHTSTQEVFKEQGYKPSDTVRLYRGISLPTDVKAAWKAGSVVDYHGNAIESWSVNAHTAGKFGYSVIAMDVPVRNIVSSARTGLGCLNEGEFVILGSIPGQQALVERIPTF